MNPEMMAAIEAERARLSQEDAATLDLIRQQAAASGRPSQYNHAIQLAAEQLQARQDAAMLEFARGLVGTPVPNTPLGGVAKGPNSPHNLPVSAGLGKGPPTEARPHAISPGVPFNKGVQTPGPQYNVEMGPVTIDPPRYNVEMGPATIDPPQETVEMGTARAREGSSSRGMPQRGVSPEFLRRLAEERRRRGGR